MGKPTHATAGAEAVCVAGTEGPLCPTSALMDFLGRRHMLHLLRMFGTRPVLRFSEMRQELRSSPNTLAARLGELAEADVLERHEFAEVPPRVEYRLTAKGSDLLKGVLAFDSFLETHGSLGRERTKRRRI